MVYQIIFMQQVIIVLYKLKVKTTSVVCFVCCRKILHRDLKTRLLLLQAICVCCKYYFYLAGFFLVM